MSPAWSPLVAASGSAELDRGTVNFWIRIAFAVAVAVVMAIGAMIVSRVARGMKRAAAELGWTYRREGTPVPAHVLAGFPFGGLEDGAVEHEISGLWRTHRAKAFILRKSPPGYSARFHVTMLETSRALPLVEIHPRGNLQRRFDIDLDVATGSAEFDKRWRVVCRDPNVARAMVTPQLMERLLAERAAIVPVTIDNATLYTWAPVHRALKQKMQASLTLLADVAVIVAHAQVQTDRGELSPAPMAPSPSATQRSNATPKRKHNKNYLAILSIILPLTFVLAPAGILFGHFAIRAARRGEANNHRWAIVGLVFSYGMAAIFVAAMLMAQFAS